MWDLKGHNGINVMCIVLEDMNLYEYNSGVIYMSFCCF